ncbi:MAG: sulfite exporter TauE/SafE family protein [Clostridiales bacterium]|nr:sulfite exporter TauE/SafE family protein [Clostridiales bacterium]
MQIFIYISIGVAGGVLGGMGMGGGTLLIPLLTMFAATEQHVAQCINLLAFIPMSIAALIIHLKNKLVRFGYLLWVSLPAVAAGVGASYLAKLVEAKALAKYFGIFLAALGVYQLVCIIVTFIKDIRAKKQKNTKNLLN